MGRLPYRKFKGITYLAGPFYSDTHDTTYLLISRNI